MALPGTADSVDCVVIGAGVIGLAAARAIAGRGLEVIVLEAEAAIGTQTSSRNSEVIHAGIYYPAGSRKAAFCVRGRQQLYEYCRQKGIAHRQPGKLIVAVDEAEIATLNDYLARGRQNGVDDLELLDAAAVRNLEPAARCRAALWSPSTGIIDSHEYMLALQADIETAGGSVICDSPVGRIETARDGFDVYLDDDHYGLRTTRLINAAGLSAGEVAGRISGLADGRLPMHRYARGRYYTLAGKPPFSRLIYPVAGQAGLGIHLTLDMAGQGRFGPDVEWLDRPDYTFDDANRAAFVRAIKRYYPDLDETALAPGYIGIRPKLAGPGEPAADFLLSGPADHGVPGLVSLHGIESPGLTASLAIADEVAGLLAA